MNHLPARSLRIFVKAVALFFIFNFAFSFVPNAALWRFSLYNTVLPGKTRLPLESDLDLLFDVHEIAVSPAQQDQYKVVLLGDSSTWGYLLNPDETLASLINASQTSTCAGKTIHLYNLGYPGPSAFRDAILLQRALTYHPQLIIWDVSLLSMYRTETDAEDGQIVLDNPGLARDLVERYGLAKTINSVGSATPQGNTFLERRAMFARVLKYQLDGIRWQATGGEPVGKGYVPLTMDVSPSPIFQFAQLRPPTLPPGLIQSDVLQAGIRMAGTTPVIIVNQPIQIVTGRNSAIRYNTIYPRWVYDQYRAIMQREAERLQWHYVDLWDAVPPTQFSDSPVHRTPQGEATLAQAIKTVILKSACP